ncbi:MAG: hypothetical protein ACOYLI_03325 [Synechococcus lacustris]|jgi:hypothetical protein
MLEIVDLGAGLGAVLELGEASSNLGLIVGLGVFASLCCFALWQQDSSNDDDDSSPGGGLMQPVA